MNFLIIEDEKPAAEQLKRLLRKSAAEAFIHGPLQSVAEAVEWLEDNPAPDLVFLDIQLADGHSFEIFDKVELKSPVIFCTAYDQYALKAFKLKSIDYLLKPIDPAELGQALHKFREWDSPAPVNIESLREAMSAPENYKSRFVIKVGDKLTVVATSDIDFFFSQSKSSFLQTNSGKQYPIDQSLDQLSDMLSPARFFRINRKYLISIDAIKDVRSYSSSRLKLKLRHCNDEDVLVSRDRTSDFKEWLDS